MPCPPPDPKAASICCGCRCNAAAGTVRVAAFSAALSSCCTEDCVATLGSGEDPKMHPRGVRCTHGLAASQAGEALRAGPQPWQTCLNEKQVRPTHLHPRVPEPDGDGSQAKLGPPRPLGREVPT